MQPKRVAIVVGGAGARGGYEAGALSVLVPRLRAAGYEPRVYVGSSAGAITATVLAASTHLPPADQARRVLELWRCTARSRPSRVRTGRPVSGRSRVPPYLGHGVRAIAWRTGRSACKQAIASASVAAIEHTRMKVPVVLVATVSVTSTERKSSLCRRLAAA